VRSRAPARPRPLVRNPHSQSARRSPTLVMGVRTRIARKPASRRRRSSNYCEGPELRVVERATAGGRAATSSPVLCRIGAGRRPGRFALRPTSTKNAFSGKPAKAARPIRRPPSTWFPPGRVIGLEARPTSSRPSSSTFGPSAGQVLSNGFFFELQKSVDSLARVRRAKPDGGKATRRPPGHNHHVIHIPNSRPTIHPSLNRLACKTGPIVIESRRSCSILGPAPWLFGHNHHCSRAASQPSPAFPIGGSRTALQQRRSARGQDTDTRPRPALSLGRHPHPRRVLEEPLTLAAAC